MREALLFCFNLKKSAAKSHRMLVEAYGDNAFRKQRAEIDFTGSMTTILSDKKRENRPRKVEDCQLQALLDEDDI